ncbi:MAG: sterol desaturase family protein, partial [Bdellovibrionales bacterium]
MPADSGSELIIYAVPVFLFLMLVEWLYFRSQNKNVYSAKDTLTNISCGAGQALFDGLALILLLSLYNKLQIFLGITPIAITPLSFFISFIAVDLSYYVYHRLSHKVPFMWAIHVAHHSSSEYNFSVGLRQAWFHKLTAFPFYLVLVVTGLPANLIGIVIATHACLQLLTHTKAFKKEIPLLRWIFVTPSHHRVHHGVQKQYWDKNFSGIFS